MTFPTAPHTEVTDKGDIVYREVVRENVRKLEAYVEEMASGDHIPGTFNMQDDVFKLWNVLKSQPEISQDHKSKIKALYDGVVRSLRKTPETRTRTTPTTRHRRSSSQFLRPQVASIANVPSDKVPLLNLKRKELGVFVKSHVLSEIATSGIT